MTQARALGTPPATNPLHPLGMAISGPDFRPRRPLASARPLRRWTLALAGSSLVSLFLGGCSLKQFKMGQSKDCRQGTLNCVCSENGNCDAPYRCERDRCVEAEKNEDPGFPDPNESELDKGDKPKEKKKQDPGSTEKKEEPTTTSEEDTTQDLGCKSHADCKDLNAACQKGECHNKACVTVPKPNRTRCSDPKACIPKGRCQNGTCRGKSTRFLEESFAQGMNDWSTDSQQEVPSAWEVKPANASACDESGVGEDPGTDHSDGPDNQLAGTRVGGCLEGNTGRGWDCIVSPKIDISGFKGKLELSYWRHLHSPPASFGERRGAQHRVYAVFNGKKPRILEDGFDEEQDDRDWMRHSHTFEARGKSLSVSFCYRTGLSPKTFAGWSVDDVRLRAKGCDSDL